MSRDSFPRNTTEDERELLPCSFSQQRCWFIDRLNPGNPALNIALRWEIKGNINPTFIERAFQEIITRHEVLRTRFVEVDGQPMQEILPEASFRLSQIDLNARPQEDRVEVAFALGEKEAHAPFDLAQAPLLRVTLVALAPNHALLLVTIHQIVFDGFSIRLLAHELGEITSALEARRPHNLPSLQLQYGDYSLWQRDVLTSDWFQTEIDFWRNRLAGARYLDIPADRERPAKPSHLGEILGVFLPPSESAALEEAARRNNVSLFTYACSATAAFLARLCGIDDIVIGTQVGGRDEPELEALIGVFINNVVLRVDASGDPTIEKLVARTHTTVTEALAHSQMPFDRLVQALNPPRDRRRNPIISVNFTVLHDVMESRRYGDFELIGKPSQSSGVLYDLNFFLVRWTEGWRAAMEYNIDLFKRETAERIFEDWVRALSWAASEPTLAISTLTVQNSARVQQPPAPQKTSLNDVENILLDHPDVSDAVALTQSDQQGREWPIAFVTAAAATRMPLEDLPRALITYLIDAIGEHAGAVRVSVLSQLPRAASGAINFALLPKLLPQTALQQQTSLAQPISPAPVKALLPSPTPPSPSPDAERALAAIWRDVLGTDQIGPESNFFDLGGHSFTALRLAARVAKELNIDLPISQLFEFPTLRDMASLIVKPREALEPWQIVAVQKQGSGAPLIAINNTMIYYGLARHLAGERPFYGVQLFEPNSPRVLDARPMESIAADYVRLIRRTQPRGPYVLIGLCVAGIIALEAARQLRREGEKAPVVILADSWAPGYSHSLSLPHQAVIALIDQWTKNVRRWKRFSSGEITFVQYLSLNGIVQKLGVFPLAVKLGLMREAPKIDDWEERWFLNSLLRARDKYRLSTYDGDVILLRSAECPKGALFDPKLGWGDIIIGKLKVLDAPGGHMSMFGQAGADVLEPHLRDYLIQADSDFVP